MSRSSCDSTMWRVCTYRSVGAVVRGRPERSTYLVDLRDLVIPWHLFTETKKIKNSIITYLFSGHRNLCCNSKPFGSVMLALDAVTDGIF